MSVEELNQVHRRYIRTSNAFKSAWTYHQFVLGLRKVFAEDGPEPYNADFQSLYGTLKEVSQNLTEATYQKAEQQLGLVERELGRVDEMLLQADLQISPTLLRQFFQRVKNYDEGILSQLIKFYIFSQNGDWPVDRIDKVDFLVTKLNEELDGAESFVVRDRHRLREIAEGFWKSLGSPEDVDPTEVASVCDELEGIRREVGDIDEMDDLNERSLVQRYRDLKHRLHQLFFHPQVLEHIIDTNLAIKNQVQALYQREEQRIVAEYQEVFELEREVLVEPHLRDELADLRAAVDRFEQQIQGSNVRLDELAKLRNRVRSLLPQLRSDADDTLSELNAPVASPSPQVVTTDEIATWVESSIDKIGQGIEEVNPSIEPKKVTLAPEVFLFGLEPREVVAYRRLAGSEPCDLELEGFVLRGAGMRVKIRDEVDEIKSILDDTAVTREAPIFVQARTTLRHTDFMMRQYEHRLDLAVMRGDLAVAQELQVLRIKLMRSYAGLWLMVYR